MFSLTQAAFTVISLCAATASAQTWHGTATWYEPDTGNPGACGSYSHNSDLVVALPPSLYANGANCWKHIGVINAANGKWVDAVVTDLCPDCESTHIDLSEDAFSQLDSLDTGVIDVTWYYE